MTRSYLPKDHPNKHLEIGQEKTPQLYVETMVHLPMIEGRTNITMGFL